MMGTIAATNTLRMLVVRPVIVEPPGILKQASTCLSVIVMTSLRFVHTIFFKSVDTLVPRPFPTFAKLSKVRFSSPRSIRPM